MSENPLLSTLRHLLTTPAYPRTSISIDESRVAVVSLKRQRGEFEPVHLSVLGLPAGLVRADFSEANVSDEPALVEHLERLLADAGINRLRRLAVAVPGASARSHVISLDSVPSGAGELTQVLSWKIERSFGCKPADVRISQRRLDSAKDQSHWLVTVVHNRVIAQYESIFKRLGWNVGLVLPSYLAEAQWLLRSRSNQDAVLLSLNDRGFVAMVVRGGQPVLVRDVVCSETEREDEFHRLMIFYRDRILPQGALAAPSRLLVVGSAEQQQRFRKTLAEALESPVTVLDAGLVGLRLPARAPFPSFAAAAGLSTFAWA